MACCRTLRRRNWLYISNIYCILPDVVISCLQIEISAKKREKRRLASGVDLKLTNSDVLAYDVSASDEDGKCTPSPAYDEFGYNEQLT